MMSSIKEELERALRGSLRTKSGAELCTSYMYQEKKYVLSQMLAGHKIPIRCKKLGEYLVHFPTFLINQQISG